MILITNRQIVETSKRLDRSPTVILLDEWGTSGRKRATVFDLLELLIKVHLYRAADFVAEKILRTSAPKRPETGPGARIDVSLPTDILDEKVIEEILKNADYPNSSQLAAVIDSTINNNNRDFSNNISVDRVKSINFFQSSDEISSEQSESDTLSDLIEFSAKTVSNSNNDAAIYNQQQPSQAPQSVFSPGLSSIDFSNLPINLPMMLDSDNQSSMKFNRTAQSASEMNSTSSVSTVSSEQFSHSMDDNQVNSTLIPDIDNLQIRDHTSSFTMPSSTTSEDTISTKIPTASDYIPNLSLLNGNSS